MVRLFHVELCGFGIGTCCAVPASPIPTCRPASRRRWRSCAGLSEKEIARKLELSRHTVHNHVEAAARPLQGQQPLGAAGQGYPIAAGDRPPTQHDLRARTAMNVKQGGFRGFGKACTADELLTRSPTSSGRGTLQGRVANGRSPADSPHGFRRPPRRGPRSGGPGASGSSSTGRRRTGRPADGPGPGWRSGRGGCSRRTGCSARPRATLTNSSIRRAWLSTSRTRSSYRTSRIGRSGTSPMTHSRRYWR